MKKIIILAGLLLICSMAYAEGVEHTIGVQADTREDFLQYCGDCSAWDGGTHVAIEVNGYQEIYNSLEEIPKGSIYLGDGNWLIKYKQNKGYMDLWRTR